MAEYGFGIPGDFGVAQGGAFGDATLIVIGREGGADALADDGDRGNAIGEDGIEEGVVAVLAGPFAFEAAGEGQAVAGAEEGVEVEDMGFLFEGDVGDADHEGYSKI